MRTLLENVATVPVVAQAVVIARRAIWSRLRPVNFFSFLATDNAWQMLGTFLWVRSIATAQNDMYLVLTCCRAFAMILPVLLGFFCDCSSCLLRRITPLPAARFGCLYAYRAGKQETSVSYGYMETVITGT